MAQFSAADLAALRQAAVRNALGTTIHWTKPQINSALQAIEDSVASVSNVGAKTFNTYIGQAIEAAAPTVFSAAEKTKLFALWALTFAARNGVV